MFAFKSIAVESGKADKSWIYVLTLARMSELLTEDRVTATKIKIPKKIALNFILNWLAEDAVAWSSLFTI